MSLGSAYHLRVSTGFSALPMQDDDFDVKLLSLCMGISSLVIWNVQRTVSSDDLSLLAACCIEHNDHVVPQLGAG